MTLIVAHAPSYNLPGANLYQQFDSSNPPSHPRPLPSPLLLFQPPPPQRITNPHPLTALRYLRSLNRKTPSRRVPRQRLRCFIGTTWSETAEAVCTTFSREMWFVGNVVWMFLKRSVDNLKIMRHCIYGYYFQSPQKFHRFQECQSANTRKDLYYKWRITLSLRRVLLCQSDYSFNTYSNLPCPKEPKESNPRLLGTIIHCPLSRDKFQLNNIYFSIPIYTTHPSSSLPCPARPQFGHCILDS